MSIIICQHGNLGWSASLRFTDGRADRDISSDSKEELYKKINRIVLGSRSRV